MGGFRVKILLIFVFLFALLSVDAQNTNLLNQDYFGFEKGTESWKTDNSKNWEFNASKKASGDYSLKFSSLTEVNPLISFDTKKTILKVRVAKSKKNNYIVASSYEGTLLAVRFDGKIVWENELSGFMNHDIWCEDITGDDIDEIFAANADGTLYCLNSKGEQLWEFKPSIAPMNAVCVVRKDNTPYVVCGGYDLNYYYLSSTGDLVKTIASSTYSIETAFGDHKPANNIHSINFLRKVKKADGSDMLAVLGTNNSMQVKGSMYLFNVLANLPSSSTKLKNNKPTGELRVFDTNNDGVDEIFMGTSSHLNDASFVEFNTNNQEQIKFELKTLRPKTDKTPYRVAQADAFKVGDSYNYFVLMGTSAVIISSDRNVNNAEVLTANYAFNDMWIDHSSEKIILASAQSGGSAIHILNTKIDGWKNSFLNIEPVGKIASILENTQKIRNNLENFEKPSWENSEPVILMTESITSEVASIVDDIKTNYTSPLFLKSTFMPKVENWDRSGLANEVYKNKRDGRKKYELTSQEVQDILIPTFKNEPGISYWGGHGNDPYMINTPTLKKIIDVAKTEGKYNIMIYPELESYSDDFAWVLNDHFYPLAEYSKGSKNKIYVRTKHTFWQSHVHMPLWSKLVSGEYADVFVPSMEETSGKTMDFSVAGRMGVWISGSVNNWGARSVPDNPSFDRLRQFSNQKLPNHFLRQMVYNIASGATYINNFAVDQGYMSLLWELIAKGALYVPQRDEILSISPVHLSMLEPDADYALDGSGVKWTSYYDENFELNTPRVFSRMNGTWPGSPVTEWDFSKYASGAKDRRQHFLPTYKNGLVLITPPSEVIGKESPRGKLTDHLHPFYADKMKEYFTDGKYYFSASSGGTQYNADTYYKTIKSDIENSSSKLPITVSGDVSWVVAQTSPTHLRLTIIDNGYLNPDDRIAFVSFNNIVPKKIVDVLDGKEFKTSNSMLNVEIPCGMFRFIDIELTSPF
ncbi:outer membrane protein assembly factor BamB family protein [Lutibacter citreus]|uniref:outer membrane protein assembly factor BamB family protein n=1 Tax=Lutibacter citreus TaxID=2138210 RepID=UPI000DBE8858|nr:PQQ-binding-like beta-propeller repeat protein [Lutibacter citreus]